MAHKTSRSCFSRKALVDVAFQLMFAASVLNFNVGHSQVAVGERRVHYEHVRSG